MPRPPGYRKYQPLTDVLAAQPADRLTLPFRAMEQLRGAPLPFGAWQSRRWWWNELRHRPQARAWEAAGWRVEAVSLSQQSVTFVHQERT